MQHTLEFSVMEHGPQELKKMQDCLRDFEAEHRARVNLRVLSWDSAWNELRNYALHGGAPDVSELGSTWVHSLINMDALRPFDPGWENIQAQLVPQLAQSGKVQGVTYGIPWTSDFRFLYYRRDVLQKLGATPADVLADVQRFSEVIGALSQPGQPAPWVTPTGRRRQSLHLICNWVWAYGGDFIHLDKKQVAFDSPQALRGFEEYFSLLRPLFGKSLDIGFSDMQKLFYAGDLFFMPTGAWVGLTSMPVKGTEHVKANYGVTVMPGVPFIGGSHLVIWKNSRQPELAARLAEYLLRPAVQEQTYGLATAFPAHVDVLEAQASAGSVYAACALEMVRGGRTFPAARLWGLVEDRLSAEVGAIWEALDQAGPDVQIRPVLEAHLIPLARRLNLSMQSM